MEVLFLNFNVLFIHKYIRKKTLIIINDLLIRFISNVFLIDNHIGREYSK